MAIVVCTLMPAVLKAEPVEQTLPTRSEQPIDGDRGLHIDACCTESRASRADITHALGAADQWRSWAAH